MNSDEERQKMQDMESLLESVEADCKLIHGDKLPPDGQRKIARKRAALERLKARTAS